MANTQYSIEKNSNTETTQATRDYWTQERMASAIPIHEPTEG